MKGHKVFLIIDFLIQTFLVGIFIFSKTSFAQPFFAEIDPIELGLPILAIWLIIAGTMNKIQYKNNFRFKINGFWFLVFFCGLTFLINKIIITESSIRIFSILNWVIISLNYLSVIYEYFKLMKETQGIKYFENILDDNNL